MSNAWLLGVLAIAACSSQIGGVSPNGNGGGGDDDGSSQVDAGESGGNDVDAAVAPVDAPACFNNRVVYLNFDGVTLVKGTSDAKTNKASWIGVTDGRTTATVAPYRAGAADRQAQMDAIEASIRAGLAQFPVTVVRTRPTSGDYVMVAFGGVNTDLGTPYTIATNELDCGDANRNDVAWVSDTTTSAKVDDYALGAIGFGLGLTATTSVDDCMCGWANDCRQPNTSQCVLTPTTLARDQTADQLCAGLTTQNAVDTFDQAFCR